MIQYITQLELKIADYLDRLDYLNKVVEILLNLDNSPPEIRRLARYDYLKMNLTSAVTLEQEVKDCQGLITTAIDDHEHEGRCLEKLVDRVNFEDCRSITYEKEVSDYGLFP